MCVFVSTKKGEGQDGGSGGNKGRCVCVGLGGGEKATNVNRVGGKELKSSVQSEDKKTEQTEAAGGVGGGSGGGATKTARDLN